MIGYYIDGIYQSRTQQQSFPMFDVSRVEVQRGPQGTLYGRNTFGGNVSVITAEPVQRFDAGVNGSIGNYNLRQFDGFVNVPVMQDVALRVSAYHSEHDGYVKSNATPASASMMKIRPRCGPACSQSRRPDSRSASTVLIGCVTTMAAALMAIRWSAR